VHAFRRPRSKAAQRLGAPPLLGTRRSPPKTTLRKPSRKLGEGVGVRGVRVEFASAQGYMVYGTPLQPLHTTREKIRAAIASVR
jgi:hypothetical protein